MRLVEEEGLGTFQASGLIGAANQKNKAVRGGDGLVEERNVEINGQVLLNKLYFLLKEIALRFHVVIKKTARTVWEKMEKSFGSSEVVGLGYE